MDWDIIKGKLIELENECYDCNQIYYIFLGLINELDISKYQSIEFDCFQMEQIYLGLLHGIYVDDYALPNVPSKKMTNIRIAKEIGSFDQIMLEPSFSSKEIYQINKEFNINLPHYKKTKDTLSHVDNKIITDDEIDAISIDNLFEDDDSDDLNFEDFIAPEIQAEEEKEYIDDLYEFYENFTFSDNIHFFKDTFSRYPLLNAEEEIKIANEFKYYDYSSWDRFLLSNIKLVISVTNRYSTQALTKDDLFQIGFSGLMQAAKRFDPAFGTKFSTYAVTWIRQAITRAIADFDYLIRIPVHYHDRLRKFNRLSKNEDNEYSYEEAKNNYQEINETITREEYDKYIQTLMLNEFVEITPELLDDNFGYTHDYDKKLLKEVINAVVSTLSAREEQVIRLRFGLEDGQSYTLEDVGKKFNVTRERIRQIEAKAIRKLKHPLKLRVFNDFIDDYRQRPFSNKNNKNTKVNNPKKSTAHKNKNSNITKKSK